MATGRVRSSVVPDRWRDLPWCPCGGQRTRSRHWYLDVSLASPPERALRQVGGAGAPLFAVAFEYLVCGVRAGDRRRQRRTLAHLSFLKKRPQGPRLGRRPLAPPAGTILGDTLKLYMQYNPLPPPLPTPKLDGVQVHMPVCSASVIILSSHEHTHTFVHGSHCCLVHHTYQAHTVH